MNAGVASPSNGAGTRMRKGLLALGVTLAALFASAAVTAQPRGGFLRVWSEPRAEIVIDGQPTGLWTPQTLELSPGHHALTLLRGEHRPSTYGFKVEPGRTTRLEIYLR